MKFLPIIAAIWTSLLACSSSKKLDTANPGGKTYNRLFIFCNTADVGARVQLEKDLSTAVAAKGYTVIKSIEIFPPSLSDPRPPTGQQITDSLQTRDCDALIVLNLKRKEDIKYNPGVKVNETNPILGNILASSLGYRTDGNDIKGVNKPSSYAIENGFHITSDLVDIKTHAAVHSGISELMEYSKLNTLGRAYLGSLIELLETKKILKK